MATHYAWVVLLTEGAVDIVTSGFARRGYKVGPLASSKELFSKPKGGNPSSLTLSLLLETPENEQEVSKTNSDLEEILSERKLSYFFRMVSSPANCSWNSGNITLPDKPKTERKKKAPELPTRADRVLGEDDPTE